MEPRKQSFESMRIGGLMPSARESCVDFAPAHNVARIAGFAGVSIELFPGALHSRNEKPSGLAIAGYFFYHNGNLLHLNTRYNKTYVPTRCRTDSRTVELHGPMNRCRVSPTRMANGILSPARDATSGSMACIWTRPSEVLLVVG